MAAQMEISSINIVLLSSKWDSVLNEEQLSRINLALKGTTTNSSEIIPNNDVVPSTTPRIVEVMPEQQAPLLDNASSNISMHGFAFNE